MYRLLSDLHFSLQHPNFDTTRSSSNYQAIADFHKPIMHCL
jgi:hypothetical protein